MAGKFIIQRSKGQTWKSNHELGINTEVHPNFQVYDMLGLAHNKTKNDVEEAKTNNNDLNVEYKDEQ